MQASPAGNPNSKTARGGLLSSSGKGEIVDSGILKPMNGNLSDGSNSGAMYEDIWRQIDAVMERITQAARSDLSREEFYACALDGLVSAAASAGGAVWTRTESGALNVACQTQLTTVLGSNDELKQKRHFDIVQRVLDDRKGRLVPPQSTNSQQHNPTEFLLILAPWSVDGEPTGVVELFQSPETSPDAKQGYLELVDAVCGLISDYHRNQQLKLLKNRLELWNKFVRFSEQVHAQLDPGATAYQIANEGRQLIACDRVSVASWTGRRCRILAVSGVDKFDRRANSVRRLEHLTTCVAGTGEPLWYSDGADELSPQIEVALQSYLDESHCRQLAVIPLVNHDDFQANDRAAVKGALVVESFQADMDEHVRSQVDAVRRHCTIALGNAREFHNLPFAPWLRRIGSAGWLLRAKHFPKTLLVLFAITAVVTALMVVQSELKMVAPCTLWPDQRRDVFAPSNGVVDELRIEHGQNVDSSETLMRLREPELDYEFRRVWGELQTAQKRLDAVQTERLQPGRDQSADSPGSSHLTAELEELKERIKNLQEQNEILKLRQAELNVRSPIKGQVLTWNVSRLLQARPVQRGQILMTVADLSGKWILEIKLPDDRVGPVRIAQGNNEDPLRVTYVMGTQPRVTYSGQVEHIGLATEIGESDQAFVMVTATLDPEQFPPLSPGATGTAKIHCGQRSLGYVWFHDLIDAIFSRLLF